MLNKEDKPTIISFMNDPSVFGNSTAYKDIVRNNSYISKYNSYISKHTTIPFTIYRDHKPDGSIETVIYHFQIESDKNPDILYDVIFKFFTKDVSVKTNQDILEYSFQFFSNSPSFLFQFAYVYKKYNLLIPELNKQIGNQALETPPSKSNPHQAVGYDYTIYYCLRFLYLNQFYLSKKEILRKGKQISQFSAEDIASSQNVLERRSPKELLSFNKLKRSFISIAHRPAELARSIGSKMGLIKPEKAKGTSKPRQARGARGPRKAK